MERNREWHEGREGGAARAALPLSREAREALKAGDLLLLTGRLFTARDQAHRRMVACLERGEPLPVELRGETIYYAGPSPAPPGRPAGAIGPTTSLRMDPYAERLAAAGVVACIGKGPRSPGVCAALRERGCVYLVAVGGAAALLGSRVRAARVAAYADLGPEAVHELQVEDLPVIVACDLAGGEVFRHLHA